MITLCKVLGGSHMYGLNTPESDIDERYVFMHDDLSNTIGLERFEHLDQRNSQEDKFGYELRHYLNLMRKTNTQVVEIVFGSEFIELNPEFKRLIIDNRLSLLDTQRQYKSLKGYMYSERRLANGERTGELGGKRKAALEKYGFSPKNFVQLLRLAYCGATFIKDRVFPVNIPQHNPELGEMLIDIKTHPEKWTKERLNDLSIAYEAKLDDVFNKRDPSRDLTFDTELANQILLEFYFPVLEKHYKQRKC